MQKPKPLGVENDEESQCLFSKVLLTSQISLEEDFVIKKEEEILFKTFIKKNPGGDCHL